MNACFWTFGFRCLRHLRLGLYKPVYIVNLNYKIPVPHQRKVQSDDGRALKTHSDHCGQLCLASGLCFNICSSSE
ncbi:hypothetical protein RSOLAG1IB_12597 [Rhizoctonia solani AG-1 IB]|uniref:Uncharacterized protein n=1 Tax=Thanatephorus cucumeris (strain AG1-IB / isolate 7/3/14) TaxID=1108050 RepID=A0A0B7G323_THACB|nr:hypothetical protein RSOLAG1IB_12597 [Rhizoctonia solani AG-1 IB]